MTKKYVSCVALFIFCHTESNNFDTAMIQKTMLLHGILIVILKVNSILNINNVEKCY